MGRGTIVSGGTDGQYVIDMDYGTARADQLITYLETTIANLDTAIANAESAASTASVSLTAALSALNSAIVTYNGDESEENRATLDAATEAAAESATANDKATVKVTSLKYQKMALESRLASVEAIDTTERATVWCVDLTEDASGTVGTIEINGEGNQGVLIVPEGRAPEDSDGWMRARAIQSAEQAFYNAAILPGWQKYAPTYRTGTISNIDYDNDTCTVTLDAATSSAQDLGINQAGLLEGVDVEYMNCNAKAFDNNDAVVVQFVGQSWASPKVIGFVSNPKPCGPYEIAFLVEFYQDRLVYTNDWGMPRASADADPDGTNSTPGAYPGYYLNTQTWAVGVDGAPTGFNYSFTAYHADLRIRFDHAFERQKASSDLFTQTLVTDIQESTEGTYYNLTCIADSSLYVGAGDNFTVTFDESGLSTDTWEGVGGPYDVVVGSLVKEYYYAAWPDGILYQPEAAAYDAHMSALWTPPANITLVIDERELNYYLVQFGPLPEVPNYAETFTYTEFGGVTTSSKLIQEYNWVIYRLGNGGA